MPTTRFFELALVFNVLLNCPKLLPLINFSPLSGLLGIDKNVHVIGLVLHSTILERSQSI